MSYAARLPLILGLLLGLAMSPGRVAAVELLTSEPTLLSLEVGTGQLIRFEGPAANVFIADPEVADIEVMSPRVVYIFARLPGQTNLFAVDTADNLVGNVDLTVVQNVTQINRAIGRVMADGRIVAQPVGQNTLLLTGTVGSPTEAADATRIAGAFVPGENVINRTLIEGPTQINLRVRIAEVSRDALRQTGISFEGVFTPGNLTLSAASLGGIDLPIAIGSSESAFLGGFSDSNNDINVLIDALAEENLVTILAEPNLTTVSGETASFLAGGEFPVPVSQEEGVITIEFRDFGVSLAFTPTLLADGRISMRVLPEVSSLSTANAVEIEGLTVPSLVTRRAETTVELGSGQSFAIAGLFQSNQSSDLNSVPLLADLPVLGPLFRSEDFQRSETELVIVVTPYLVEPVSAEIDYLLPGQPLSAPTDRTVEQTVLGEQPSFEALSSADLAPALAGGRRDRAGGFILN